MQFKTVSIPMDETLQDELAKLYQQGWRHVAELKPQASYVMCREPQPLSPLGAVGQIVVDESKVFITKPDGTQVLLDGVKRN
jgi:hypothetical protein